MIARRFFDEPTADLITESSAEYEIKRLIYCSLPVLADLRAGKVVLAGSAIYGKDYSQVMAVGDGTISWSECSP